MTAQNPFLYLLTDTVLASRRPDGSWSSEFLTRSHNGTDEREIARVRDEHPGEPECIKNGRVLGAIAPFRCEFILIFLQTFRRPRANFLDSRRYRRPAL